MKLRSRITSWIYRHPNIFVIIGLVSSLTFMYSRVIYEIATPPTEAQVLAFNQRREELRKRIAASNRE